MPFKPTLPGTRYAPPPSDDQFTEMSLGKQWKAVDTDTAVIEATAVLKAAGGGYLWQPWWFVFRMPDKVLESVRQIKSDTRSTKSLVSETEDRERRSWAVSVRLAYRQKQSEPDLHEYPLGWIPVWIAGDSQAIVIQSLIASRLAEVEVTAAKSRLSSEPIQLTFRERVGLEPR